MKDQKNSKALAAIATILASCGNHQEAQLQSPVTREVFIRLMESEAGIMGINLVLERQKDERKSIISATPGLNRLAKDYASFNDTDRLRINYTLDDMISAERQAAGFGSGSEEKMLALQRVKAEFSDIDKRLSQHNERTR